VLVKQFITSDAAVASNSIEQKSSPFCSDDWHGERDDPTR
jgi:hypothetical protein